MDGYGEDAEMLLYGISVFKGAIKLLWLLWSVQCSVRQPFCIIMTS